MVEPSGKIYSTEANEEQGRMSLIGTYHKEEHKNSSKQQ